MFFVCFAESPLLFSFYSQKSLHFVKRRMEGIIDQCLQKPAVSVQLWVRLLFSEISLIFLAISHNTGCKYLWKDLYFRH